MSHGSVHHAEDPLLPRVAVLTHLQTQPGLVLGQGEAPAPHQLSVTCHMSRVTCHVSRSPARGGVSEPGPAVAPALVAAAPRPVAPHHPHLPRPVPRPRVQAAANQRRALMHLDQSQLTCRLCAAPRHGSAATAGCRPDPDTATPPPACGGTAHR